MEKVPMEITNLNGWNCNNEEGDYSFDDYMKYMQPQNWLIYWTNTLKENFLTPVNIHSVLTYSSTKYMLVSSLQL